MDKLKVYVGSVVAFSQVDAQAPTGGSVTYHTPIVTISATIEEAVEYAKGHALYRWPIKDGWYGHQAAILPIPGPAYVDFVERFNAGAIDTGHNEPMQVFEFQIIDDEALLDSDLLEDPNL